MRNGPAKLKRWYVVDAKHHLTSRQEAKEKHEVFWNKFDAIKRAKQLSGKFPEMGFFICEAVEMAIVRRKPVERVRF